MTTDRDVAEVLRLERELQTPECRRDRARLSSLLADDFIEVGASGRVWDRASTLELLGTESEAAVIEVCDLAGRVIADGLVMARWELSSRRPPGAAHVAVAMRRRRLAARASPGDAAPRIRSLAAPALPEFRR